MKTKLLITASIFMLNTANIKAQVTLDNIVDSLYQGISFYPIQISSTETKYVFVDTVSNTFSLYNMNFTPFLTNISVPEPLGWIPTGGFQPIYITRSLFDCDTSNIEYLYTAPLGGNNKPVRVVRTDGTILFQLDSAIAEYSAGAGLSLSDVIRPIRNTSAGAKLYLIRFVLGYQQIYIYSLCGTLPTDIFDFTTFNQSFVKIFPNPTSNSLTFNINSPDNINEYELVILDNNSKEVRREKINFGNDKYSIDVSSFSSGIYFYSLCTKNKTYQSGKFILTK